MGVDSDSAGHAGELLVTQQVVAECEDSRVKGREGGKGGMRGAVREGAVREKMKRPSGKGHWDLQLRAGCARAPLGASGYSDRPGRWSSRVVATVFVC